MVESRYGGSSHVIGGSRFAILNLDEGEKVREDNDVSDWVAGGSNLQVIHGAGDKIISEDQGNNNRLAATHSKNRAKGKGIVLGQRSNHGPSILKPINDRFGAKEGVGRVSFDNGSKLGTIAKK